MPGAGLPRPGNDYAATGLRVLAELINDVLASMGTHPAVVGPSPALQAAIQTPPVSHKPSRLRGRSSRALHAEPTPPEAPEGRGVDDEGVDENHVEIWRLVRLAQGGDGEAFGRLYDSYVDAVFRFIYFRVNDRALAEDFTSETFLRALRRIGTITYQGRDIGAWFITIARNIVLDHMKSARHRLEITTADTIEGKEHAQSTETAVLESLAAERLMEAVALLGDEQRECVMLRFIQGLSVSETASVMGKNDGAIKALQHRAVRKLADLVGSDLR
ncbi:MAG: polymerase sigma-70 factor, subfamily [Pseudonocardiales bacterium]|jgi:RNA polymerase sigma-70 factor (ECF subfamily)|nr:polymerase sigma-70 factor, subfamily [Pseudonocardiales bacterium]MDT4950643.1 polymerase sigma-70 factor, subfamily [Pseudonocardiales bacterium]